MRSLESSDRILGATSWRGDAIEGERGRHEVVVPVGGVGLGYYPVVYTLP
jgi:hypothetical protein